jgi:guanylate kinase
VLFDIDWQGAQQIQNSDAGQAHAVDLHPAALDPELRRG